WIMSGITAHLASVVDRNSYHGLLMIGCLGNRGFDVLGSSSFF
ncbi:MAG: hypothetical protein ACI9E1_001616, partial [Cryomorphaceae bacterium]